MKKRAKRRKRSQQPNYPRTTARKDYADRSLWGLLMAVDRASVERSRVFQGDREPRGG